MPSSNANVIRVRKISFNKSEIKYLMMLVNRYPILRNKTSGSTVQAKREAWKKLTREYNAMASPRGRARTMKNLFVCYKSEKMKCKNRQSSSSKVSVNNSAVHIILRWAERRKKKLMRQRLRIQREYQHQQRLHQLKIQLLHQELDFLKRKYAMELEMQEKKKQIALLKEQCEQSKLKMNNPLDE